ncbi:MAG: winged helix-turn-helix domain-containing protein [Saccharothrix sp.]|nr:winged helix-turn-helix domain-containing protein [Saccharothrix sp.]
MGIPAGGRDSLAELIGAEDRGPLFAAMGDYTPEGLLIGGPLWTRQAVVELIRLVVGVDMTEQGVGLWLRRHGFTPRRPARRAYEQRRTVVHRVHQVSRPCRLERVGSSCTSCPATAPNPTRTNCGAPTSNATSTPPEPTTSTDSPARPDASCTAASAGRTSSAAPSCRQPNTFGSNNSRG